MHTLPAAKVVGHDFLGNHIGELLFRQPVSRPAPSSGSSTIGASDSKTLRRGSTTSAHTSLLAPAKTSAPNPLSTLDARSSVSGATTTSLGASADPVAALEQSSEGSTSEPSSVETRSSSADADLNLLHLDQLDPARRRNASEGAPTSPRISFVTNFGAKPRRSGSRRAPSEAGSSSYFGLSSNLSSASMSPMEPSSGAIAWNVPFREQHPSFAKAVEHNPLLNRNPSQHSESSAATSASWQLPPPSASQSNKADVEVATPTASAGTGVPNTKSQSFSGTGSSAPVRQRLTRAATESALDPVAQRQLQQPRTPTSPNGPSEHSSSSGMAPSKSMGSTTSGVRGHRRKPSLVPKGDDERTFCFVNDGASDAESDQVLIEEPEAAADATLTSVPEVAAPVRATTASNSMSQSSSQSSYRDVVEGQYRAQPRSDRVQISGDDGPPDVVTATARSTMETEAPEANKLQNTTTQQAHPVVRGHDTQHASANVVKVISLLKPSGSSRPVRRLRIQPNVQSRPSLLERTMEQQRKASQAAIAANCTAGPSAAAAAAAITTLDAGDKSAQTPGSTAASNHERYDPVAYGAGSRTFRIQSSTPTTENNDMAFAVFAGADRSGTGNRSEPASHARTSDWARAQSLLAGSQPEQLTEDLTDSCTSLLTLDASRAAVQHGRPPAQSLLRHHTASHSSESTDSPSLLDARETLSPPDTAISTPELESPPEHALDAGEDGIGPCKVARRPSPLSS
ncbi:conserved hypothetical protein [Sporisorium reilianum SRZ2]|uniref:Uncharacterized protein n=1 Tax=Sporisorium reilianum (strain SRZ2) TaxID=999809 RepID=E6ZK35_SPORE|nr:conserved hypothetical protein [Sporisorium reilianum SRZ2]